MCNLRCCSSSHASSSVYQQGRDSRVIDPPNKPPVGPDTTSMEQAAPPAIPGVSSPNPTPASPDTTGSDDKTIVTEDCDDSDVYQVQQAPSPGPMLSEGQILGRDTKARIAGKLCTGSFGEIYLGQLVGGSDLAVAVKVEEQGTRCPQVLTEGRAYTHLEGGPGIPKVYWYGLHEPLYSIMIMDLMGPNLEDLRSKCGQQFSLKTALILFNQILDTLEFVHSRGYVHRDIKPSNFAMGLDSDKSKGRVHLLDFGLAKRYSDTSLYALARWRGLPRSLSQHSFAGTPRFASLPSHLGAEPGPRDDLESLTYMMVYFLKGSLPWQNIQAVSASDRMTQIVDKKRTISCEDLCADLPEELPALLAYSRSLAFCDMPDYDAIRTLFNELMKKENIHCDGVFDWTDLETPS